MPQQISILVALICCGLSSCSSSFEVHSKAGEPPDKFTASTSHRTVITFWPDGRKTVETIPVSPWESLINGAAKGLVEGAAKYPSSK